jgi:S-adenosylmethionine-diacylglycerol 3-amino-3-carboxypropyl transferase
MRLRAGLGKPLRELQRIEFEARIFVSFGIVLAICLVSAFGFRSAPLNFVLGGRLFGFWPGFSIRLGFILVAALMVVASLLRMWAGSALSSQRMMAFRVQNDRLITGGPYRLVRHPIYLADFIAFFGFALCLKPIGFLMPVLLYIHYIQLVSHEERALTRQFGTSYSDYARPIPRFLPDLRSLRQLGPAFREFEITADGFRHNALYLLFIPGFLAAAWVRELWPALAIGLPAVFDWAVVHTIKGLAKPGTKPEDFSTKTRKRPASSKVVSDILYAQCWEDPQLDLEAFAIQPGDTVFSITSGGCNVLAFLAAGASRVIALDLSPFQNHVLNLKMAAFRALSYGELLAFLGATPSARRPAMYAAVRDSLGPESRNYWDRHPGKLERGIIHTGRYEGFMQLLRRWFFRLLDGQDLTRRLFAAPDRAARERLYFESWNNRRWRMFTRVLLNRRVQSLLFDPAFFAQLGESFSFGEHFQERVRHAVVDLEPRKNWFLSYILRGGFEPPDCLPPYLRRENFERIRDRLDRVQVVLGSCEEFFPKLADDTVAKFNFTNIFEWMTPESVERLLRETVRVAKDGAVLTYRNLLVPRSRPESLARWLVPDTELSRRLHEQDLSFIYRAYVVERVRK